MEIFTKIKHHYTDNNLPTILICEVAKMRFVKKILSNLS